MTKPDAICASCALTFAVPAIAKCPLCGSQQVRRLDHDNPAAILRGLIGDARAEGDDEGADALQRVLDRFEKPAPSVMSQVFDVLAVKP